jgi:hypothetical protein
MRNGIPIPAAWVGEQHEPETANGECMDCDPFPLFAHPATQSQTLRDESTPEGKKIWAAVDRAAARAPEYIKRKLGYEAPQPDAAADVESARVILAIAKARSEGYAEGKRVAGVSVAALVGAADAVLYDVMGKMKTRNEKALDAAPRPVRRPAGEGDFVKRLCVVCGKRPPTVPDRERMGRPIKRVCTECHGKRLQADMTAILRGKEKP